MAKPKKEVKLHKATSPYNEDIINELVAINNNVLIIPERPKLRILDTYEAQVMR